MLGWCVCGRVFINLQFLQIEIAYKKYAWWKQISFGKTPPFITYFQKKCFLRPHKAVLQGVGVCGVQIAIAFFKILILF